MIALVNEARIIEGWWAFAIVLVIGAFVALMVFTDSRGDR